MQKNDKGVVHVRGIDETRLGLGGREGAWEIPGKIKPSQQEKHMLGIRASQKPLWEKKRKRGLVVVQNGTDCISKGVGSQRGRKKGRTGKFL